MEKKSEQHIYAIPVTEPGKGESAVYRDPSVAKTELISQLPGGGEETVQDILEVAKERFATQNLLGARNKTTGNYQYITYKDAFDQAVALGSGIENLGLAPVRSEYKDYQFKLIGLFAKNRPEWCISDMANALFGYTMVPFYDTLGPESISYVLDNSQIETCITSAAGTTTLSLTKELHKLKTIVTLDEVTDAETIQRLSEKSIKLVSFQEVQEKGKEKILKYERVKPTDILTFSYTSGTTGNPKGAMLSHRNFVSCVYNVMTSDLKFREGDNHLSFLPLPHAYERCVQWELIRAGATINYYGGDVTKITEDLQTVKPDVFLTVPRLLNRFYDGFQQKIKAAPPEIKAKFDAAIAEKTQNLYESAIYTHETYDVLFADFRKFFGGKVRSICTGAAPIAKEVLDFMKVVLSCHIIEGYGQTESSAASFLTSYKDPNAGHVGGVRPSLELKVVDVPEMNYLSTDKNEDGILVPRGEICTRGGAIIDGYYKDDEKTKEAIDSEGWLHSGDIGAILPNGALKIVDRKKNIFKLAQGEYIAPEKLENIFIRAPGIAEAFVYGDSLQAFLVGFLVPSEPVFLQVAESAGITGVPFVELCKDPQMNEFMLKLLEKHGRENGLQGFEMLKKVHFEPVSLATQGCFTSTMKMQRHVASKVFAEEIQQMYA